MNNRLFGDNDGIDEDNCLVMYGNDYGLYKLILETFCQDMEKTRDGMKKTFAAKDTENYRVFVHGMKGAGGSAGAKHLVDLATRSNELIKEGRADEAYKMHDEIIEEMSRLITLIPERIAAHNGTDLCEGGD